MRRGFITKILERGRADAAYPVIRASVPGLGLAQWRRFVAAATAEGSRQGIVVVENARGYIHALGCYRVDLDLLHGHTLAIDHAVVLDFLDDKVVATLLIDAVDRQAQALGCQALEFRVRRVGADKPEDHPLTGCLVEAGYAIDSVRLVKIVGGGSPAPAV